MTGYVRNVYTKNYVLKKNLVILVPISHVTDGFGVFCSFNANFMGFNFPK